MIMDVFLIHVRMEEVRNLLWPRFTDSKREREEEKEKVEKEEGSRTV